MFCFWRSFLFDFKISKDVKHICPPSTGGLSLPLLWDLLRGLPGVGAGVAGRGRLPAPTQRLNSDVHQHSLLLPDAALPILVHFRRSWQSQWLGESFNHQPLMCFSKNCWNLKSVFIYSLIAWDGPGSCPKNQKILQKYL